MNHGRDWSCLCLLLEFCGRGGESFNSLQRWLIRLDGQIGPGELGELFDQPSLNLCNPKQFVAEIARVTESGVRGVGSEFEPFNLLP